MTTWTDIITTEDAARITNLHPTDIHNAIAQGRLATNDNGEITRRTFCDYVATHLS